MKNLRAVASALVCTLCVSTAQSAPLLSYFPQGNVAEFLAKSFDLASIRSSFGPRRTAAQRSFADFGMTPSTVTEQLLEFDTPGSWYVSLKIVGRRDFNRDGIEDLAVCFTDEARNGGTYRDARGLLITRYAADAYALALNFSLDERLCDHIAR